MSDLISRSELLKRFCINKDGHRIPERDCDNFEVTVSVKDIKTIIKEQPTVYDVDKIIEELELHSFELGADTLPVHYVRLNKAIEIVKADGKDEKEKINIMGHNSIEEQKQVAKNTNELLNYLIEIIEQNNKRFSFEWAVGGEHATMEIFDNEKEIDYVVNIKPIKYDETGKAINV